MNIRIEKNLVRSMHKVSEFFYKNHLSKLLLDIQDESPEAYQKIIQDVNFSLEDKFESEVARRMNNGNYGGLIPANTLMPAMMSRFGVSKSDFSTGDSPEFETLEEICNNCSVVGTCWKSMRAGASAPEARTFCPSAEAFQIKGKTSL
ncbi:hypothetical protein EBB56_04045 [Halomonas sp. YLB-10]|uniref:hypothetical protein n=1 Tax=unclassified Halomonas TaxID=2609666 RepID=UPI000F5E61B9|nr:MULTISPECIES: hypothetical protein [unclassified Halomonas]RQW73111.1 hypothetical protein EBB56_04045 [Halomonas sp. YLB-10]